MRGRDAFGSYHPLVNFLYFGVIFAFAMLSMHPVCLLISFASSAFYYITLKGSRAAGLLLKGVLPLMLFTMIVNPVFSHGGLTPLCYLPSGNPLTLESVAYGAAAGVMLTSILLWFACFTEVITSDKFVYLFGRFAPALSLLLSMTLRFVPRFKAQFDSVREAQRLLGRDTSNGGVIKRVRSTVACFSAVVTWSMENAIDTADSMKSRGYGTKKRTAYSIYRFEERDAAALAFIVSAGFMLLSGGLAGKLRFRYYPSIRGVINDRITIFLLFVFLLLCLLPVITDVRETVLWKRSRLKI